MVEGEKLQKQPAYRVAKKQEDIVPPKTKDVAFKHPEKIGAKIKKIGDELNPDIQLPPGEMLGITVRVPEMVKAARIEDPAKSIIHGKTEIGSGKGQIFVAPETLRRLVDPKRGLKSVEAQKTIEEALGRGEKPVVDFAKTVEGLRAALEREV